jgi:hypothetical protein
MPDRHDRFELEYRRRLAARDPIAMQRYVHELRSQRFRELASAALAFVLRLVRQTPGTADRKA